MTTGAFLFWLGSWTFVLGLTGWCFYRVLKEGSRKRDQPPTA